MGIIRTLDSDQMADIQNKTIVGGFVDVRGHLLLKSRDNTETDAGSVVGPITTGLINLFAGAVAPTGWLICDGLAISRTQYSALFSIIGTTYGSGDGTTTFNLPNLKGRIPAGLDASQTEFASLGQSGGEKTHLLAVTEMPSHTHLQNAHGHTLTDPGHNHTQNAHGHTLTDPGHNHTQNAHGHTQNSHGHTESSHTHNPIAGTGFQAYTNGDAGRTHVAAGSSTDRYAITTASTAIDGVTYSGTTDTVTPTIASTTATNQSTTATNNSSSTGVTLASTTGTNNSSTTGVTASSTTATNQNTGGGGSHNNLQPYLVMNYIIHT